MTPETVALLVDAIEKAFSAGTPGPPALEGIAIALAGWELKAPLGPAVNEVADAIRELADAQAATAAALKDVAQAIKRS